MVYIARTPQITLTLDHGDVTPVPTSGKSAGQAIANALQWQRHGS